MATISRAPAAVVGPVAGHRDVIRRPVASGLTQWSVLTRRTFEILVRNRNGVSLLQMADEFQYAGGIDDAEFLQRVCIRECESSRLISEQEVIDDELPQLLCMGLHEYPHRSG